MRRFSEKFFPVTDTYCKDNFLAEVSLASWLVDVISKLHHQADCLLRLLVLDPPQTPPYATR